MTLCDVRCCIGDETIIDNNINAICPPLNSTQTKQWKAPVGDGTAL